MGCVRAGAKAANILVIMKTWKKVLIGVGAALVLGIIVAVTVYQSRKNLVTVQTGKVQKQNPGFGGQRFG
jgi:hypothetical protein